MIENRELGRADVSPAYSALSESGDGKDCIDTMIWVGKRFYSEILCNENPPSPPTFLYPPKDRWPQNCFVHEAELRGCCRKVPGIPSWITPGKSRIFLAHQNGWKKPCGALFGYYVLNRIEIVTPRRKFTPGKKVYVPRKISKFEALRSCGMRPNKESDTWAVYFVDALAADIIDEFVRRLNGGPHSTMTKRLFFGNAVIVAGKKHASPSTRPHSSLKRYAQVHGELVLLDRIDTGEYPIIVRRPWPAFCGLLRVDGEELIREIKNWYDTHGKSTIKIPYCGESASNISYCCNGTTWTPASFACTYGFTKKRAQEILERYCSALGALEQGGSCTIHKTGIFTKEDGELQFTPVAKCHKLRT